MIAYLKEKIVRHISLDLFLVCILYPQRKQITYDGYITLASDFRSLILGKKKNKISSTVAAKRDSRSIRLGDRKFSRVTQPEDPARYKFPSTSSQQKE